MSTVRRHIEVDAPPSVARATWSHLPRWLMTGHQRLACDELASVDAVRAGLVAFEPVDGGSRTAMIFNVEAEKKCMIEDEEHHSHEQLHRHIGAEDEPVAHTDHFPT